MPTSSLATAITSIGYSYLIASGGVDRRGLYINAASGSPQLSFEPVGGDPVEIFAGDMWYRTPTGSDGNSNFFVGDDGAGGVRHIGRVLVTRTYESSSQQLVERFDTNDRPVGQILAVNSLVADDWLVTANSPDHQGSGWRNDVWGGGIYMSDSQSVAIYGEKDFLVPSGSGSVRDNLTVGNSIHIEAGDLLISSGSINVSSGSINVLENNSGVYITGDSASLHIAGTGSTAFLRDVPILTFLTGSIDAATLTPVPANGTVYLNTMDDSFSIRVSGSWVPFTGSSIPETVDGGVW